MKILQFFNRISTTMIDIFNLKYKWPGQEDLLLNIQKLHLTQGQKIFIQGSSGSGKTTLLNIIGGVLLPQSGAITILGTDISRLNTRQRDTFRADHTGFIFQQFNLVPYLSVLENVLLPCWFSKIKIQRIFKDNSKPQNEAIRLLKTLGIDISTDLNKQVIELSVGQQQRVAAARALIGSPEIIVADEPTSSLDLENQQAFNTLLFEECRKSNTTLVYVSHDTRLMDSFDMVLSLDNDELVSQLVVEKGGAA